MNGSVLLIDAHPAFVRTLESVTARLREGWESIRCLFAGCFDEAYSILQNERVQCIFVEPHGKAIKNDYGLVGRLKSLSGAQIVIVTSHPSTDSMRQARDQGVYDYLTGDVDLDTACEIIQEVIADKIVEFERA